MSNSPTVKISANDPKRKSWIKVNSYSDFPIQNIPFGVFITRDDIITIGTRIGEYAIDLGAFHQLGYFKGIELTDDMFMQDSLNDFISDGRKTWRLVRNRIADVFDALTSERPYKKAWTLEAAVDFLLQGSGKHFDPQCVQAFLDAWEDVLDIRNRYREG